MASYANLSADQGADFQVSIDIEDANGDSLDLSAYEVNGQVRRTYKSTDAVDFDIVIVGNPADGSISIRLSSVATGTMKAGRYVYDIYATNENTDNTIKVLEGILEVIPSVTRNG